MSPTDPPPHPSEAGHQQEMVTARYVTADDRSKEVVYGEGRMSLGPFDNLPVPQAMDPSLQFLIASGLTEVVGRNPELVGRVLSDLDRGWAISMDGSHIHPYSGLYSGQRPQWWDITRSDHAGITFDLHELLNSYVDPDDRFELIGHEIAHSLDAYNSSRGPDGVPSNMNVTDRETLLRIRHNFFTSYISAGSPQRGTHLGLEVYAFTNREEFWAEISEFFLSGQNGAARIHAASPELYGVLSRFYGIQYPGLVPA